MEQKFIDLHEDYVHGLLNRREFINKLALMAGGTAAAYALLPLLDGNDALAGLVPENDSRLISERVSYPGATGEVKAYLSRPKGDAKFPAVVVVHENRGLNPHIEDVNRRMALEGFLALAPDALSPVGGTPADQDAARDLIRKLDRASTIKNFTAAVQYLKTHPKSTGKVGITGFCWGGAMTNQVAVNSPDVIAAVPYYGSQPTAEDVPKIKAALLMHYAELDNRINKGIAGFEEALKKAGKEYKMYMYKGAKHAFNNDTNAARYNQEAAQLAWKRTIAFFTEKLKE